MTAQFTDRILVHDKWYSLFSEPLECYWDENIPRPPFDNAGTALWRRYIAIWEIGDSKLYIINFSAKINEEEIGLNFLFPRCSNKVFAEWFTGILRIPTGNLLKYIHSPYASIYEYEWIIKIVNGYVIAQDLIKNELPITNNNTEKSWLKRLLQPH